MAKRPAPLSMESRALLLAELDSCIAHQNSWWRNRLWKIDLLYYCMDKEILQQRATQAKIEEMELDKQVILSAPVITSQIETAVSTLMDTFLSGYPLFGVVASPAQQQQAEQVETLIGHYDRRSKWKRQLIRFFRSITKYGIAPLGLTSRYGYDLSTAMAGVRQVNAFALPQIIVPDPYNMLFDSRVPPAQLRLQGDYIGYAEMLPRNALQSLFIAMESAGETVAQGLVNLDKLDKYTVPHMNWNVRPVIREDGSINTGQSWDTWYAETVTGKRAQPDSANTFYNKYGLLRRMWYRLIPEDYGLGRYGGRTPMIFEVWYYNDLEIVYLAPCFLPENAFPIGQVDLQEDNMNYDAKSETELFAPFQRSASTLLTAAALGAERAVDDRAIYDANFISKRNLTAASGSGYIPLTKSLAMDKDIRSVYHSIPYDASTAYAMPGLIKQIVDTAQLLRGRNNFAQGLPTKGNRTLGEFGAVMQNSDTRQQMPAMVLEATAFEDLKVMIKWWISSHATKETLLNLRSKQALQIDPQAIADIEYDMALATGYFSKPSMANTAVTEKFLQLLLQVPQLQQQFDVGKVVSYVMSMEGVKDLDQFILQVPQVQPQSQPNGPQVIPAEGDIPQ